MNELLCAKCKKPQKMTPSGIVCDEGHGGADTVLICGACQGLPLKVSGSICESCARTGYVPLDPFGDYLEHCPICDQMTVHSFDEKTHTLICEQHFEDEDPGAFESTVESDPDLTSEQIQRESDEDVAALLAEQMASTAFGNAATLAALRIADDIARRDALAESYATEIAREDALFTSAAHGAAMLIGGNPLPQAEVVPIRTPPAAPPFLDAAAIKAGYQGRTHEWASLILEREANYVLNGAPAIEGTDWRKQAEAWKLRATKLTEYCVLEVASALMKRKGNRLTREQAVLFAHQEVEKISGGTSDRPKIIIPGKGKIT